MVLGSSPSLEGRWLPFSQVVGFCLIPVNFKPKKRRDLSSRVPGILRTLRSLSAEETLDLIQRHNFPLIICRVTIWQCTNSVWMVLFSRQCANWFFSLQVMILQRFAEQTITPVTKADVKATANCTTMVCSVVMPGSPACHKTRQMSRQRRIAQSILVSCTLALDPFACYESVR